MPLKQGLVAGGKELSSPVCQPIPQNGEMGAENKDFRKSSGVKTLSMSQTWTKFISLTAQMMSLSQCFQIVTEMACRKDTVRKRKKWAWF